MNCWIQAATAANRDAMTTSNNTVRSVRRARQLHRRTFLAGLGGAAVPLPFLEIMSGKQAHAAPGAPRYVVGFGGISLAQTKHRVPTKTGTDYTLPRSWAALQPVKQHVTLVTGLKIPWVGMKGSATIQPGGRETAFHASTHGPILSGFKAPKKSYVPNGPTSDQIVVPKLAGNTPFTNGWSKHIPNVRCVRPSGSTPGTKGWR